MNFRRSDFDVTNRINTTDPVCVQLEVVRIYRSLYERAKAPTLDRAFDDMVAHQGPGDILRQRPRQRAIDEARCLRRRENVFGRRLETSAPGASRHPSRVDRGSAERLPDTRPAVPASRAVRGSHQTKPSQRRNSRNSRSAL